MIRLLWYARSRLWEEPWKEKTAIVTRTAVLTMAYWDAYFREHAIEIGHSVRWSKNR